jgi:hypothetical protein
MLAFFVPVLFEFYIRDVLNLKCQIQCQKVNICVKNQQLLHVSALHCHLQGAFLVPSGRCSIEEQSIEYCGWARSQIATHHVTRPNTPTHNILSTAPQLSISQKALRMLPEDGNVMPKRVGATIHN